MLTNKDDIKAWLDKYNIEKYIINDDMTVDVKGIVDLSQKKLTSIPVQFGHVTSLFDCSTNQLTSLKGSPHTTDESFICYSNKLTNLLDGSQYVGLDYVCENNPLTSLEGCPIFVKKDMIFDYTTLVNLDNFNTNFEGTFIHSGNPIPILEEYYFIDYKKTLKIELTYAELNSILLHGKLQQNIPNKEISKSTKLKI